MEDQIGTVFVCLRGQICELCFILEKKIFRGTAEHWNHQKEPEQAKSKDEVIRRNRDRIHISAATLLPSNPSRHKPHITMWPMTSYVASKWALFKIKKNQRNKKNPDQIFFFNISGCQNMCLIKLKFKTFIPHHH